MVFRNPSFFTVVLVALLSFVSFRTCFGDASKNLEVPGFQYLGSYHPNHITGRKNTIEDFNRYYVSEGAASWGTASEDCSERFETDEGELLWLSSFEELQHIAKLVFTQFKGAIGQWTSGYYSEPKSAWVWSANEELVQSWVPWKGGAPSNITDAKGRIILSIHNEKRFFADVKSDNALRRYICKRVVKTPPKPTPTDATVPVVPCYKTLDLELVLDSSGSVGADNFQLAVEYIANLTTAFTVHNQSRLGYITFSTNVTRYISLNNTLSPQEIRQKVKATYYDEGDTYTHLAVDDAVASLQANKRPAIPRAMVVVTDGKSNDPNNTIAAAVMAKNLGIEMYCVGVTNSTNPAELLLLAGNVLGNVFEAENWNDLLPLLTRTSKRVCPK